MTLLLQHGVDPCKSHKKNGCTPLHNAHFCTIDDTDPSPTIEALVAAGASVNSAGGTKCGKLPVDHAIQHQRLDAVQARDFVVSPVLLNNDYVIVFFI